jgi:hypothetical protein
MNVGTRCVLVATLLCHRKRASAHMLSHIFHNWFYAGHVVNERYGIMPKTVEGLWETIVNF